VFRVERTDPVTGNPLRAGCEFGVEAEMNIGSREEGEETRQLLLERAPPELYVEEEQRILPSRPTIHPLDERRVSALAIFAVAPRGSLGNYGNQMQRRLHWRGSIGRGPRSDFTVEPRQHRIDRLRAEHSHASREGIAVERDDAARGEN